MLLTESTSLDGAPYPRSYKTNSPAKLFSLILTWPVTSNTTWTKIGETAAQHLPTFTTPPTPASCLSLTRFCSPPPVLATCGYLLHLFVYSASSMRWGAFFFFFLALLCLQCQKEIFINILPWMWEVKHIVIVNIIDNLLRTVVHGKYWMAFLTHALMTILWFLMNVLSICNFDFQICPCREESQFPGMYLFTRSNPTGKCTFCKVSRHFQVQYEPIIQTQNCVP